VKVAAEADRYGQRRPGAGECANRRHRQAGAGRQRFRVQPFRVAAKPDYGLEWFTVTEVVTVDFPPP